MRVDILKPITAICLLVTCGLPAIRCPQPAAAAEKQLQRYEFQQIEMGVPFRIVLYADNDVLANKAARAAYARIKRLNAVMSDYDPDSELMRLCRSSGPGKPVRVSPELQQVLRNAAQLSTRTGGAFDVTVGPLVRLWRIARRRKKLPETHALKAARQLVGYRNIRLDRKAGTVKLLIKQMRLDLGGIAKGFAGDAALKVLKKHGITRALIDGSGDVVVGDPPPGRDGWVIEVFAPKRRGKPRAVQSAGKKAAPKRISLANAAVATSGDAFQFVKIGGNRYSHIIDPKTGLGLTISSSVTVIAPNGMAADSLASAVSVLGPQRGLKLIDKTECTEALVIQLVDGRPREYYSRRFSDSLTNEAK